MRRKLLELDTIRRASVGQLAAYLMMPFETYASARVMGRRVGTPYATLLHYLHDWELKGLVEKVKYEGEEANTRYQYRRLYNRISITRSGVLFELVREG